MAEPVDLHPGAPLAPAELLDPPWPRDGRRLLRDLAAILIDRHLRRLMAMRHPVERRLGRLLSRLRDRSGYLELGFATLGDYATERLGIAPRRLQALLDMDRRFTVLPRIAAAFESGRLSFSHVRLVIRVATPATEAYWLETASRLTVRRLERAIGEWRAAARQGGAADAGAPEDGAGGERAAPASGATAPAVAGAGGIEDDEDDPGCFVSFSAPHAARGRWEWALEVCRRVAGASEPAWRCAEYIAADFLSGVPDLPALLAGAAADAGGRDDPPPGGARGEDGSGPPGGAETAVASVPIPGEASCFPPDEEGAELFEEILKALEEEGTGGIPLPPSGVAARLPDSVRDDPADDARRLDARLRELAAIRQGVAWHEGRLLNTLSRFGLHRDLGFTSLARYCRERLGVSLRRARSLIALDRRLAELPALESAYRGGALSWVRAAAVARVASERTENAWIDLAGAVTVRRLRDEAAVAEAALDDDTPWEDRRDGDRRADRRGFPPGMDAAGRVQPCAPGARPIPPGGGEGDGPAAGRDADGDADGDAAVQTCAPASGRQDGPSGRTVVRFWAPGEVARFWRHALDVCRLAGTAAGGSGATLEDWECVDRMIASFRESMDVRRDAAWRRRYRVFERDGWRCRVPGCTSRRSLHVHHVVFRSRGGGDGDDNLVTVCATHHLRGLHAGHLRCRRLPEGFLLWELGTGGAGPPLAGYVEDVLRGAAPLAAMTPTGTDGRAAV